MKREIRTYYVCIGNLRPVKVETYRLFGEGDIFEFQDKTVEIMDIHKLPKGIHLQVEEV